MAPTRAVSSKKTKQDDSIMGTNNSSIVSKRSVERTYYPEPHFYRYFVKKPQRRSPLINRGYWLRMYAVDRVVRQFLQEPSEKRKIVLNLGCGYDVLPFQFLSRNPSQCNNTIFVDVDYPLLMTQKCEIINNTCKLRELLGSVASGPYPNGLFFRSDHYRAVGCDLGDIRLLDKVLSNEVDLSNCLILCTAEVSITYMSVEVADALVQWAAQFKNMKFCLLEQYLPGGPEHPFAQKMVQHFNNLNTPLRSIHTYPKLKDQEHRFHQLGWSSVSARSLWDLSCDDSFMSLDQRLSLNTMEPFDEWEELVLFASHYFLLVATTGSYGARPLAQKDTAVLLPLEVNSPSTIIVQSNPVPMVPRRRRFGALLPISATVVGHHGGQGSTSRTSTTDLYSLNQSVSLDSNESIRNTSSYGTMPPSTSYPEARMCHTITRLNDESCVMVGGRISPEHPLRDCWLLRAEWKRIEDLPYPLYRHCATHVTVGRAENQSHGILIYGGKIDGCNISDKWLLWRESLGWEVLQIADDGCKPRFGAVISSIRLGSGVMFGGMTADGTILSDLWEWTITCKGGIPNLTVSKSSFLGSRITSGFESIRRFGASLTNSSIGLVLIGGVSNRILPQTHDIVKLSEVKVGSNTWQLTAVSREADYPSPLLVGHSTIASSNYVFIVGGGAVCFSFGTYWNTVTLTISTDNSGSNALLSIIKKDNGSLATAVLEGPASPSEVTPPGSLFENHKVMMIEWQYIQSADEFESNIHIRQPAIFKRLDIGLCTGKWTLEYLESQIGIDREVVVHQTTDLHMDFQQRNFSYVKKKFGIFVDEIRSGSRQYLRSTASQNPAGQPAELAIDFPQIANDFKLPPQLDLVGRHTHSSVLRISGSVHMWLHYDVMANVLCQINGTKKLLLFPPSDVSHFSIPPGASSSSINCFHPDHGDVPALKLTHPREALLEPGDVLYIPPLWLHTASPIENVSISVNIFFRDLDSGYSPGKDVYGNRDLHVYEKGRKDIEKLARSFDKLPSDVGKFYLDRLADELKGVANSRGSG